METSGIEYIDLVLDTGQIICIECTTEHYDGVMESINNARARKDWWSVVMYDGTYATFMGMSIDRIDMQRVVGML